MPAIVNGEIDPKLIGPGVPSGMSLDGGEGPAPKRRGSAFDTRLAQLHLNDRRGSVDARGGGQATGTRVELACGGQIMNMYVQQQHQSLRTRL